MFSRVAGGPSKWSVYLRLEARRPSVTARPKSGPYGSGLRRRIILAHESLTPAFVPSAEECTRQLNPGERGLLEASPAGESARGTVAGPEEAHRPARVASSGVFQAGTGRCTGRFAKPPVMQGGPLPTRGRRTAGRKSGTGRSGAAERAARARPDCEVPSVVSVPIPCVRPVAQGPHAHRGPGPHVHTESPCTAPHSAPWRFSSARAASNALCSYHIAFVSLFALKLHKYLHDLILGVFSSRLVQTEALLGLAASDVTQRVL
ncbi:unnamed protein product, partial [Iphiclides podalirius]